jgi:hypothetical protein
MYYHFGGTAHRLSNVPPISFRTPIADDDRRLGGYSLSPASVQVTASIVFASRYGVWYNLLNYSRLSLPIFSSRHLRLQHVGGQPFFYESSIS